MKSLKFTAEKKGNDFKVTDYQYKQYIDNLKEGNYTLEIKKFYKKRTKAQNRTWHGYYLEKAAKHFGYETKEELAIELKMRFKIFDESPLGGTKLKSTADMTTIELKDFMDQSVRLFAQMGFCIADPDPSKSKY